MIKHIHGGDVYSHRDCIDFSANLNPLGTPECVKQAVIDSAQAVCFYPQVGSEPLKEALARYEQVEKTQLILGNGAAEIIFLLCQCLRPKEALLAAPTFAEYEQALAACGARITLAELKEENGFALQEDFLEKIKRQTDMVFLCNPNNPTGVLTEREFLYKVLRRCRETDTVLVVDECFLDFVSEPEKYTLKAQLERYPGLILLKAFTKRYAIPGLRLGYAINAGPIREAVEKCMQPWNISVPAQMAGLAALSEEAYVQEARNLVFGQKALLIREMEEMGLTVYGSEANYIFFKGPAGLYEKLLEEKIVIRDCSNFRGLGEGFYRTAVKTEEENRALTTALKKLL